MFREKKIQKILSALFLGVYLFVALASQSFHHHPGSVLRLSDGKSAEKSISDYSFSSENSGCLWCHFLHSGHTSAPETFTLELRNFEVYSFQTFTYSDCDTDNNHSGLFLRGPPTYII